MISVRNLRKSFNGQEVLKGIDLDIAPGEVLAIIGPSGSGKTTLLRCLNLLEQPSGGQISVGTIHIDADKPLKAQQRLIRELRQHVGFVFQNFNLFPHRTALENVIEGPVQVKKEPRSKAIERCWPRSVWTARRTPIPGVSPAASNSAWRSPAHWRCSRT